MFGEGFFGDDEYKTKAAINIISESARQGANALSRTCHARDPHAQRICDAWPQPLPQLEGAAQRLNAQYLGLDLTSTDIFWLMSRSRLWHLLACLLLANLGSNVIL
jgi:acid phosphatase